MIKARGVLASASLLFVAFILSSCSTNPQVSAPAPSATNPAPTASGIATESQRKPNFSSLVVEPTGLGSLHIGKPVSDSDMVMLNPTYCTVEGDPAAYGYEPGDPAAGRWLSNYPQFDETHRPFAIDVKNSLVTDIQIFSSQIATEHGIHVGSSLDELRAAYPALKDGERGGISSTHYIVESGKILIFEVLLASGYYPDNATNSVLTMRVSSPNMATLTPMAGSDASVGGCL